jgi:hypothetical protein
MRATEALCAFRLKTMPRARFARHYVGGVEELDSTLPREAIMQIFDELAPPAERGPLTLNKEFDRLEFYGGNTVTAFHDYENVSIDISRPASSPGDIVAVIQWKHRPCQ